MKNYTSISALAEGTGIAIANPRTVARKTIVNFMFFLFQVGVAKRRLGVHWLL